MVESGPAKAGTSGKLIPFRRREPAASALYAYAGPPGVLSSPAPLQSRAWPQFDDHVTHPGHGLEPRTVNSIFRSAEEGVLWRQADLFDDVIESDGHLRSLIESRRDAVSSKEWVIQPGAPDPASVKAAELLSRHLRDSLNFHEFLEHQLSAPYYGYACSEMQWGIARGMYAPIWFHNLPHRRFTLVSGNQLELAVSSTRTVPLQAGNWVVSRRHHHNLARAGLMRTCTWWALFKRMSVRDWVVFAERFGVPFAIGVYEDRAAEDTKKALEEALATLGNAGYVVLHEATKIVFSEVAQRAGDSSAVHPALIALCEAQMSKLINGATQNVEQGAAGSYAQARVHETRSYLLSRADANSLASVFVQCIGLPFLRFNGFPEEASPPRLKMQVFQEMDPETRVTVASKVANELGGELDRTQLYDDLGFRLPGRPEDSLRGTKTGGGDAVDEDEEAPDAD